MTSITNKHGVELEVGKSYQCEDGEKMDVLGILPPEYQAQKDSGEFVLLGWKNHEGEYSSDWFTGSFLVSLWEEPEPAPALPNELTINGAVYVLKGEGK